MRTNVVIDDQLMAQAIRAGTFRTKKSAIEAGLRLLIQIKGQQDIRALRGKVQWKGDLAEMRKD